MNEAGWFGYGYAVVYTYSELLCNLKIWVNSLKVIEKISVYKTDAFTPVYK